MAILLTDESFHKLTNKTIIAHHRIEIDLLCYFNGCVCHLVDQFFVIKRDKAFETSAGDP